MAPWLLSLPSVEVIVDFLWKLLLAVLALLIFWLAARRISGITTRALQRTHADPQTTVLVARVAFLGLLLLGGMVFFAVLANSPGLVFGGFGVLALAFSLAFQDILKNLISGVFLLLERPFRIGDEIEVDGLAGTVLNVELRATTLRTVDGQEVLVPNSIVYARPLFNRTRFDERQYLVTAKLPPAAGVDGIARSLEASLQELGTKRPSIGVNPNIDGGLTLEVRYWLNYAQHDPDAVRTAIGQRVHQLIQEASTK